MQPSLKVIVNTYYDILGNDFPHTFRHALFVLPGTKRAIVFHFSVFSPYFRTASVRRASSCGVHGRPMFPELLIYIGIYSRK